MSLKLAGYLLAAVAAISVRLASGSVGPVRHGWQTVGDMIFAHGSSQPVLENDALAFLADNYPMVTFGDCYGKANGTMESAVLSSAAELKNRNPQIRNLFYFKVWLSEQITDCSTANVTWSQHPEWRLRDDFGNLVTDHGRNSYLDPTNAEARAFWVGHLLDLADQSMPQAEGPAAPLPVLNGFFIDGTSNSNASKFSNISDARYAGLMAAQAGMVATLQEALDARGRGQFAVTNGLDTTYSAQLWHRAGGAMVDHFGILQFLNRTSGEMLPAAMQQLLLDVVGTPLLANRTIQIKGWPGPIVQQKDKWPGPPAWPQPVTPADFRREALAQFNNALSYFLLVAEDNMWWGYSWFWDMLDVEPVTKDSTVPSGFYPQLKCELGAPQGPARRTGAYVFEREFQHASVRVDLESRADSRVEFHGKCN